MSLQLNLSWRLTPLIVAIAVTVTPFAISAEERSLDRRVPSSSNELRLSYAPVVQRVAPAVVNVYAAKMVANRNPLFDDPIFRRFFGMPGGPGGQGEQVQRSLGSGVIVDASGLVVTNHHVIEGADQVQVSLADKREFEAEIVLKDARSDLAVLRIKAQKERFPALEFADSDALLVGDLVLAIGNPFAVGQTVTHGIVSAVARTQIGITDYQFFIQTDAAINPGNSGGALVDLGGRLVGVNTAIFSRSGGSQGIGFAIPANMVKVVVASARSGVSTVRRPFLGARLQAVTAEIAESLGFKRPSGALIASVTPARRAQDQRPHHCDRWAAGRGPQRLRLPLRDQADRRQHTRRRHPFRQGDNGDGRPRSRPRYPARRTGDRVTFAVPGRQSVQYVAGAGGGSAARSLD